jgi:uncharacterized protein YjeT (DUF2065 family)
MVAQNQLEIYTTAVLQASIKPPSLPREAAWRSTMDALGELSCKAYRCVGAVVVGGGIVGERVRTRWSADVLAVAAVS